MRFTHLQTNGLNLAQILVRNCRRNLRRIKFADSMGHKLTGGSLLTGSLALQKCLRRKVLQPDEEMVGVLLPPSVAAVLVNAGLSLDRRIPVNLNYTLPQQSLDSCV
jgi:acyl-[acyl-carrier-protein]-phospholipid O-acyltransferase/long-chain-fatty-acid--[acyl-carrier-protein] ligase